MSQNKLRQEIQFTMKVLSIIVFCLFSVNSVFANPTTPSTSQPINIVEEKNKLEQEENQTEKEDDKKEFDYEYKIELLVFAYVNTGEENSEMWRNPPRPDFSHYQVPYQTTKHDIEEGLKTDTIDKDLNTDTGEELKNKYTFLDIEDENVSDLKSIIQKMKINGHYRTLQHLVWQQKVLEEDAQDIFYLQGNTSFLTEDIKNSEMFNKTKGLGSQTETTSPDISALNNTVQKMDLPSDQKLQQGEKEFEGTIHIYRSRFLHIKTDLWLSEYSQNDAGICLESESFDVIEQESSSPLMPVNKEQTNIAHSEHDHLTSYTKLTNFQLNQHRRLRSSELHYLDHPRFGLLIKFTRVEKPKITTEVEINTGTPSQASN